MRNVRGVLESDGAYWILDGEYWGVGGCLSVIRIIGVW